MNPARVKDRKAVTSSTVRKLTPIEPEQLDVLAPNVTDQRRLLVLLAAWGGLRYGELVALRRGDLDLRDDYPVLHVSRSVTFLTGQEPVPGPPKSDAGVRDVTLPSALKALIAQHLLTFTQPGDDDLLFPGNKRGGYLWPSVFHKEWRKAREAAGLPRLRVHDLRHASAVWALQTGESFSGVQARLGHSTPQAALRYQHAASGADGRIAKGLDAMRTTTTQASPTAADTQASSAS